MKKLIPIVLLLLSIVRVYSQESYPKNTGINGLEKNLLFNAQKKYSVTQTGVALLNEETIFDGKYVPSYTTNAPTINTPTVILIEDLPAHHVQRGAWVGWSTRWWPAGHFKIEGYNTYGNTNPSAPQANTWFTIAEDSTNLNYEFIQSVSSCILTKLRFTFYSGTGVDGRLGVSELFFLHNESAKAYDNLVPHLDKNLNLVLGSQNVTDNNTRGDLTIFASDQTDEKASVRIGYNESNNFEIYRDRAHADIHLKANQANGHLRFATNNSDATFDISKFGIGTTNTAGLWQSHSVFSHSGNTGISIESTSSNNSTLSFIDSRSGNPGYDNGGSIIYQHSSDELIVRSKGAERLRIDPTGKIGVGIATPTHKFQVYGSFGAGSNLVSSGWNTGSDFTVVQHNNTSYAATIGNGGGNGLGLNIRAGGSTGSSIPLRIARYDDSELLKINGAGQLSLGQVLVPSGFLMAVDGKAYFEKVVVKNSNNWPDYVFSKSYELKPLSEVKSYIDTNGHLEGVPTAGEINSNGQDLSEMNRVLLEKVEELTLYIIDLQKQIDSLK